MLQSLVIDWMFLLILPVFFGTLMMRIMLTSEDQGYNHSVMRRKRMSDCRYDFLYALKTPTDCVFLSGWQKELFFLAKQETGIFGCLVPLAVSPGRNLDFKYQPTSFLRSFVFRTDSFLCLNAMYDWRQEGD